MAANVLTVTGYTSLGALDWEMADMMQGAFCSERSGNSCEEVQYLSGLPNIGESTGLWALRAALATATPPTMVMGFSQGAMIATDWIKDFSDSAFAPSPDELSFVFMGNPQRKYGGVRPIYDIDEPTPADTAFRVLDIAREYDGAADLPDNLFNLLALANALAGFEHIHINGYDDVDLDSSEKLVWIDGNTTYVLIRSQNIPLLQPLRNIGLGALADRLNGPLKAIIDSAYDRDYVGLVDPQLHDEVLAEFPHAPSGTPTAGALASQSLETDIPAAGDSPAGMNSNSAAEEAAGTDAAAEPETSESDFDTSDLDTNADADDYVDLQADVDVDTATDLDADAALDADAEQNVSLVVDDEVVDDEVVDDEVVDDDFEVELSDSETQSGETDSDDEGGEGESADTESGDRSASADDSGGDSDSGDGSTQD